MEVTTQTEFRQSAACPYCQESSRRFVGVYGDEIFRCRGCKLMYLVPLPDQNEMVRRHMSEEYSNHDYFTKGAELEADQSAGHHLFYRLLERHLQPGSSVIDVGAGYGDFTVLASKKYKIIALEPSRHLAEKIRQRTKSEVVESAFEDFQSREKVDAVALLDIIEHAADPRKILSKAKQVLKPGGLILVSTVNSDSLLYEAAPLLAKIERFVPKAGYFLKRIFCYQHNWYFNTFVLAGLLKDEGFNILEHERFEFPLQRLNESWVVILGLKTIYRVQNLFGRSTEQYIVARLP